MPAAEFPGDDVSEVASFEADYYSSEEIADRLMWPLVNQLWGDDWRQVAVPGSEFALPKSALYDGWLTYVKLSVNCMMEEEDGHFQIDEPLVHDIELQIAKTESEFIRDLLLSNIPSGDRESVMTDVDQDSLAALKRTTYYFSDQNFEMIYSGIDEACVLQTPNGGVKWIMDSRDDPDDVEFPEVRFREHDLDILAFGAKLLTGQHQYDAVVNDIKKHPVTIY